MLQTIIEAQRELLTYAAGGDPADFGEELRRSLIAQIGERIAKRADELTEADASSFAYRRRLAELQNDLASLYVLADQNAADVAVTAAAARGVAQLRETAHA
jgi:hypothetical protein